MTQALTWWERAVVPAVFVVLVWALAWQQPRTPAPWTDEGQHLVAAATLVRHGVYGAPNAGVPVAFDPAIQVGPPLILPVAIAFALGGVGELPARVTCVVLSMLFGWLYWRVTRRLVGPAAAALALVFLVAGGGDAFASFVFLGRQVIGEPTAIGWLLVAFLVLMGADALPSRWRMLAGGACLGAAILTKGQMLFIAAPALAVLWCLDRLHYRQRSVLELPIVVGTAIAMLAGWQGLQRIVIGAEAYAANAAVLRQGLATQILAFDLAFFRNALGVLWRSGIAWWGPLALAGMWRRARPATADGYRHAWLALVALGSLAWFVGLSVGWARYAAYAVILMPIWACDTLVPAVERLRERGRTGVAWAGAVTLALLLALQARQWLPLVIAPVDTGLEAFRAELARHVPDGTMVETWEWEIMLDDRLRYAHPPLALMYTVTGPVMRHDRAVLSDYDPLWAHPRFIVRGPYGGWTQVYDRVTSGPGVREVVVVGRYALYEVIDSVDARSHRP